ncbi:MAG TPA: cytochrome b [Gammaproteobacteria bacterium]|nr:cytochrome b [Gammaproteobacteria bacterium]
MPIWRNTPTRYGAIAQTFHWLIVALVIVQFALGHMADDMPLGIQKLATLARHKSLGMTILMLAVLRLAWRLRDPPPPLPAGMPDWEKRAAHITHALLYILLFALPLTGWLMSSAKNFPVSWFGLFTFPDLVAPDPELEEVLEETHEMLGWLLAATAVLHALAALRHHFIRHDDVLRRMLPLPRGAGEGR